MARRKAPKEEKGGAPEWMVTYGDLVTLLLTFFVMLFSFSTIDAQKWQSLVSSFAGGSGILDGGETLRDSPDIGENPDIDDYFALTPGGDEYKEFDEHEEKERLEEDEFIQLYRAIEGFLNEAGIPAEVKISDTYTEILLRFRDSVLFDTGEADIKDEAQEVLNGIGGVLKRYDDEISRVRVDGHADIRPINTRLYPTNWELSAKRAVNVVRHFSEEEDFKASKLSAAAYGEFHPINTETTTEAMAKNRRVEIFIVKSGNSAEIIDSDN